MAIVKMIPSSSPLGNIFNYVQNKEKTEPHLISGKDCMVESAQAEFEIVKSRFNKTGGRNYYHVIQSFAPDDDLTPEEAHDIGMELASFFNSFQVLVVTHTDRGHLHNHLVVNSVSHADGKKLHTSQEDLLRMKSYSNKLCARRGLSTTEEKSSCYRRGEWKTELMRVALRAMFLSETREDFIEFMEKHGYGVKWNPDYKYITFTTPDGKKVRDNKLFDERLLKGNLELYFAMGGCASEIHQDYWNYKTPPHDENAKETITTGLMDLIGDLLCQEESHGYTPRVLNEMSQWEKERLERILGRRISNEAFIAYCTREDYEQSVGLRMSM